MEAIVLVGGLGTRLRPVLPADLPKPLAPVAGRPFLHWLLERLAAGGIRRIVLSVGWQAAAIRSAVGSTFGAASVEYSPEDEPLGTGGAIQRALRLARAPDVLVLNGDTFLEVDYGALLSAHRDASERLTIACVAVPDVARYGRVDVAGGRVRGFREKGERGPGLINGGTYVLSRNLLASEPDRKFSFEADFLAPRLREIDPRAFEVRGRFIDIGVPEDLERAPAVLSAAMTVRIP
jgi:D-glycero-alpha-D-manno-heptose 1-phosphate guanylyltransferase